MKGRKILMSKTKRLQIFFYTVFIMASITGAQEIVYNNFGQDHDGWDYKYNNGWTVAGIHVDMNAQFGVEQAMAFESNMNGYLSDIWVGFFYVPLSPQADTVYMRLTAFNDGPPQPEDIIEEWVITEFDTWDSWSPPIHLEGNGTSRLNEGETYWLWAVSSDTTWCGWCVNPNMFLFCLHTLRRENEDWLPVANEPASVFRVDALPTTDIADTEKALPSDYTLSQNYPNPFNMSTNIEYSLTKQSRVYLSVYDILGHEIDVLVNQPQSSGHYRICWHADNSIASGVYYYRLQTDYGTLSKRMVLTK
jgi:hypothetical protein